MTGSWRSRMDVRAFFAEVHALQRRWDPLRSPFHARWTEGALTTSQLARYASEHEHVVIAAAVGGRRAAESAPADLKDDLLAYAQHAAAGIEHWQRFCDAIGASSTDVPSGEAVQCARVWAGDATRSVEATLAMIYTVASTESRVAVGMRDALAWRYGVTSGGATSYFYAHAERHREHAGRAREHLEQRHVCSIEPELLGCVDAALAAYWQLFCALDRDCDPVLA
jgi:pyrroloquinoline quinone (PQQ) biosynthesis protein C